MTAATMRVDLFLWYVRIAKTRSIARDLACDGHLRLDGRAIDRAHAPVRVGNILTFAHHGHVRVLRVAALPHRRGPAPAEPLGGGREGGPSVRPAGGVGGGAGGGRRGVVLVAPGAHGGVAEVVALHAAHPRVRGVVRGPEGQRAEAAGSERGWGFPVTDEYRYGAEVRQRFSKGVTVHYAAGRTWATR